MPKPSNRKHSGDKLEELNLAPIMSILVILIPMLIFAFNYTEIVVQNVSLPKTGGPSKNNKGPKKLKLNVLVSDEGFRVKVGGDPAQGIQPQDKLIPKKRMPGCEEEGTATFNRFDYAALYNEMIKLRDNQTLGLEETINIGAKDQIPWRVLAKTIETVRLRREENMYNELCPFFAAKAKIRKETDSDGNEMKIPVELFPKIVFIVL